MNAGQKLNKAKLGQEIKRIRESKNLTQEDVANHFNWHKQAVSDIETGKAQSLEKIMLLSNFLDVSLDSFKTAAFTT
jgi:transcriptional regulator with XRE-family HTH domain